MLRDGHIHTPYCPHGTKDNFEEYIKKAIEKGFSEISFTEHAPLPESFIDTTPDQDSGMQIEQIEDYIREVEHWKHVYKDKIRINCGLEIDFIEGYEEEITKFLSQYGPSLDDSILSVHFLKHQNSYDCLDYSPSVFEEMIHNYGSLDAVYLQYFRTVLKSIQADLGVYKPKRIGHITLVRKFQKRFSNERDFSPEIIKILEAIKENGCELDYNGAGTRKPLCGEPYPPHWVVQEALKRNIPLVYGSDAHQVKELKQGYDQLLLSRT
jgi:histidinol-phosphatase (PHP family)